MVDLETKIKDPEYKLEKIEMQVEIKDRILDVIIPDLIKKALSVHTKLFVETISNKKIYELGIDENHIIFEKSPLINKVRLEILNKITKFVNNININKIIKDIENNKYNKSKNIDSVNSEEECMTKKNIENIINLDENESDHQYEVKAIVDEQTVTVDGDRTKQYLVEWERTWEPIENLDGCKKLINTFLRNKKKLSKKKLSKKKL